MLLLICMVLPVLVDGVAKTMCTTLANKMYKNRKVVQAEDSDDEADIIVTNP